MCTGSLERGHVFHSCARIFLATVRVKLLWRLALVLAHDGWRCGEDDCAGEGRAGACGGLV